MTRCKGKKKGGGEVFKKIHFHKFQGFDISEWAWFYFMYVIIVLLVKYNYRCGWYMCITVDMSKMLEWI